MDMKTIRRRLSLGHFKKSKCEDNIMSRSETHSRKSSVTSTPQHTVGTSAPPKRKSAPPRSFFSKLSLQGSALLDLGRKASTPTGPREAMVGEQRRLRTQSTSGATSGDKMYGIIGHRKTVVLGGEEVRVRDKQRFFSEHDLHKRHSMNPCLSNQISLNNCDEKMTRKEKRHSLSAIGFGKIETYQRMELLGQGTYATVYKGRSRLTESVVALKVIRLEPEEGAPCTAIREVSLLRDLRHANIVTLHDIIYTTNSLTLVFEYLEKDLKQYMEERKNRVEASYVKLFMIQLLRGLAYCHARRILHRDLKPQNLLINERSELKLADFGLARAKSIPTHTYSNEVVTLWYRPPDVLLGDTSYSGHIDIWGAGCIFFEMIVGKPAFPGSSEDAQLLLIFKKLGTPTEVTWPGISRHLEFRSLNPPIFPGQPWHTMAPRLDQAGLHLLSACLQLLGSKRITADQALRHPYFASLLPPDLVTSLPPQQSLVDAIESYQKKKHLRQQPNRYRQVCSRQKSNPCNSSSPHSGGVVARSRSVGPSSCSNDDLILNDSAADLTLVSSLTEINGNSSQSANAAHPPPSSHSHPVTMATRSSGYRSSPHPTATTKVTDSRRSHHPSRSGAVDYTTTNHLNAKIANGKHQHQSKDTLKKALELFNRPISDPFDPPKDISNGIITNGRLVEQMIDGSSEGSKHNYSTTPSSVSAKSSEETEPQSHSPSSQSDSHDDDLTDYLEGDEAFCEFQTSC